MLTDILLKALPIVLGGLALFIGLNVMSDAMKPLAGNEEIKRTVHIGS